ncbi:MAG TPA: hypothetical protein VHD88_03750 [Pyrinomonadaceae bacterium]|nr:hypothetical protein [Pyrinomonadaceae bacterium]
MNMVRTDIESPQRPVADSASLSNMPKHDAQATVANFDSQYWHCGESDEIAAPQLAQLRVFASMITGTEPAAVATG